MDDKAIRGILIEWLQANYPEGRIYQEKSIGESVCDVMLVSDCLTGFEIKSDRDSYRRLPRQVEYYQQYFDYNYLVVGERHGASAGAKIPDNWGIIVVCEDGINLKRKPKYGSPRLEKQLRILWKAELNNILSRLNVPMMTYKSKDYIVRYLAETQESKELQEKIHEGVVYELLHRDYDTLGIGDPTVSGEAKDSSIYCEMPVSEMIDTLSEQDLQQFTLDHWIELYAKARKLKEAKVYKYKKPGRERVSSVEHTIKYKDIEATPGVPWMDRRIINEFIFYLINGYEIWESKGRQNYNLADFDVRLRNTVKNEEYLLGFSREQYKQEVGKIKDFLSESVIRKEEPMPDDLFVMDFAISVPENQDEKKPYLSLKRLDTVYRLEVGQSVSGNARRLYNFFDSFSKQKEQIEDSRKKLRASIKELEAIAAQKNPYPEQIAALRDEVSDLEQGIAKKASD